MKNWFSRVVATGLLFVGLNLVLAGCGSTPPTGGGTGTGTGTGGGIINPIHHSTIPGSAFITAKNTVYTMTAVVTETDGKAINFSQRIAYQNGMVLANRYKSGEPNSYVDGRDFGYPSGNVRTISSAPYPSAWDIQGFERRQVIVDVIVGDPYDPFSTPLGFHGIIIPQTEVGNSAFRQYQIVYSGIDANGRAYDIALAFNVNISISGTDPYDPYSGSGGSDPNDPFSKIQKK